MFDNPNIHFNRIERKLRYKFRCIFHTCNFLNQNFQILPVSIGVTTLWKVGGTQQGGVEKVYIFIYIYREREQYKTYSYVYIYIHMYHIRTYLMIFKYIYIYLNELFIHSSYILFMIIYKYKRRETKQTFEHSIDWSPVDD